MRPAHRAAHALIVNAYVLSSRRGRFLTRGVASARSVLFLAAFLHPPQCGGYKLVKYKDLVV